MLMILAIATLIVIGPGYRLFREWRMERILVAAHRADEADRMLEARDLSLTVLRSGGRSLEALRILERATRHLTDPRHGQIANSLLSHPDATQEDRHTGFVQIAASMPLGLAGQAWASRLEEDERTRPEFAIAFSDRLMTEQRFGESAQVLLAVPEDARDDRLRTRLARLLVASGREEGFAEARRRIARSLAEANGNTTDTSKWLDVLESIPIPNLRDDLLSQAIQQLMDAPGQADPARLTFAAARIDLANTPQRAAPEINTLVEKWRDRAPVDLANFLRDAGLHEALFEAFPPARIESDPDLMPVLLDAAWQANAWETLIELLDEDAAAMHLPPHLSLTHRAVAAAKLGDSATRGESWRSAIAEARSDPTNRALIEMHRIAMRAGLREIAVEAMTEAIRNGNGPLPLYEDIKHVYQTLANSNRDHTLFEICAIYLNFEPANPVLLTQFAYISALTDAMDPAIVIEPLERLAKSFPDELPIHTTLASAHLCAGNPEQASRVLRPFDHEVESLSPPFRIVFLVTRLLTGEITADHPALANFPWDELQSFERRKFTSLIQSET